MLRFFFQFYYIVVATSHCYNNIIESKKKRPIILDYSVDDEELEEAELADDEEVAVTVAALSLSALGGMKLIFYSSAVSWREFKPSNKVVFGLFRGGTTF